VRKASRDALSRSEEYRPSAFFPGPPITLTRWTTEPAERRILPWNLALFYLIRCAAETSGASTVVGHVRKVVQQPGPLGSSGPANLTCPAHHGPLDSDGSKAHSFDYRECHGTRTDLPSCLAWRWDWATSVALCLTVHRSSEGTGQWKTLVFLNRSDCGAGPALPRACVVWAILNSLRIGFSCSDRADDPLKKSQGHAFDDVRRAHGRHPHLDD
jgi:hypothetical protein